MALVDLIMPALGEGIMEATVLKWHKMVGDHIEEEEMLLDIATDKVDSEVPSTATGTIKELMFKENEVAPVGSVIAIIDVENGKPAAGKSISSNPVRETAQPAKEDPIPYVPESSEENTHIETSGTNNGFYSPLVMSIAQKEGIGLEELSRIKGTGNEGRLSKKDLLNYLANKTTVPVQEKTKTKLQNNIAAAPVYKGDNVEIIEMDRMRKLIAHHMKESQNTSATVTSFAEVDVTNMVEWRNRIKAGFEKREQTKITFTPLFIDCVARTIKRFPLINSSVVGDQIYLKKNINIGMATALPNGNLIVPVIKNADYLNLVGLSKAVNDMAQRARTNSLKPVDTQDGTFTITNVGSFGSLTGTPIINQPEVAILAIGTIKKRPVVIETLQGDTIGIRHMMILALSYDHRIIDGGLGSTFLSEVAKEIEGWDSKREV